MAAVKFIESTAKKFYKSELPAYGPGDPVQWLGGKYRQGWTTAPHYNRHSDNNNRARPRGKANSFNPVPRVMVMPDAGSGHVVMRTQEWVLANMGITVGFD